MTKYIIALLFVTISAAAAVTTFHDGIVSKEPALVGDVGIGGTMSASAIFEMYSTTKGMLPPRMTTVQMNAVSSPAKGLVVYNTDENKIYHYTGSAWEPVLPAIGDLVTDTDGLSIVGGVGAVIGSVSLSASTASSSSTGLLTSGDWSMFDGKQDAVSAETPITLESNTIAITLGNITTDSNGLSIDGGTGAVVGGVTISASTASASSTGLLTDTDWSSFDSKADSFTVENPLFLTAGTISAGTASASTVGWLTNIDWNIFNNKQDVITAGNGIDITNNTISATITAGNGIDITDNTISATITAEAPLSITSNTISASTASASSNGVLTSTDWSTFNSKQNTVSAGEGINISDNTISSTIAEYDKQLNFTTNLITVNSGFESGDGTAWSASISASLTVQSDTVSAGTYSAKYSPSTAGNFVATSAYAAPGGLQNRQGGASFMIKGCSPSVSAQILTDGTIAASMALQTYTDWYKVDMPFPFGTASNVAFRLYTDTTTTGDCYIDDLFIGDAYKMLLQNLPSAKQYTLTVTGTHNYAVSSALGYPYKDQNGVWRMAFNIYGSAGTSTSSLGLTISGVLFDATTNNYQPLAAVSAGQARAFVTPNTANINLISSTVSAGLGVSGDVALAGKPTWASDYQVAMAPEYVNRVAGVKWSGVANCQFTATAGVMSDSDCTSASATVYGSGVTAGAGTFAMSVSNIPAGKYMVGAGGVFILAGSNSGCIYSISDGSTTIASSYSTSPNVASSNGSGNTPSGIIEYSSFSNSKTFSVVGTRTSGTGTCDAICSGQYQCNMYMYPLDQGLPNPMILNSVSTFDTSNKICRIRGTCSSSSSIAVNSGCAASIGKISGGACTISFASGSYNYTPICLTTPYGADSNYWASTSAVSSSQFSTDCVNSAGSACSSYTFVSVCF